MKFKVVVAIISMLTGVILGASATYGSNHSTGSVTAPSASPIPATIDETLTPVLPQDFQAEERAALRYMRSPGRIAKYESDFRQAGVLIAKALDAGKFAPVTKRYDDWKEDRKPGYSGWGGISTLDNNYYAWVWWNCDGSISYTRMGVTGFAISGGGIRLQIEQLDSGEGPFQVFLHNGSGPTRVSSTYFWHTDDRYDYPQTLDELPELDEDVWAALDYAMILNFGINWRQLR